MQKVMGAGVYDTQPAQRDTGNEPGYFGGGDPATGRSATTVTYEWLNDVQEEICNVITGAGITLDASSQSQLKTAIAAMITAGTPAASETVAGIVKLATQGDVDEGENNEKAVTPATLEEKLKEYGPHFVGQWVQLRNSSPPTGYYVRNGALIESASTTVPKLWAYLQETANTEQCITQTEWDTMQAATYTLSDDDETEVAIWDGIGGVPFYVLDTEADTLRLPDTRGMYAEDSGFDGMTVGASHGDMIRNINSSFDTRIPGAAMIYNATDAFASEIVSLTYSGWTLNSAITGGQTITFNPARVVPTGSANKPRGYGMLGCIYAG